ncbi:MAG: hypothetical protein H6662_14655 [Ardenticatenaceae bacterium]|nr:hypothetical protein [Anaerolineales bacterium]MCB8922825.1 hypothetical protein [Ardenticatenaceae bacterium]MCB9004349.1 hypothetical protein [Ardenticatenaceae bacterium]
MATTNPLMPQDDLEAWGDKPSHGRLLLWLGVLNGLFVGVAISLGAWGGEFYRLADLPVARPFGGLGMSSLLILLVCTLAGWLTVRLRKFWITVPSWVVTAVLITIIIANTSTTLQTTAVWLADRRFWGLPIYPSTEAIPLVTYLLTGLFLTLALFLLSLFQETRLQDIGREFLGGHRPGLVAWLRFILPLLIVAGAGAITSNIFPNPFGTSLGLVNHTIQVARAYEGDLFALGLEEGNNYAGINAVRDQLDGGYTINIGSVNEATGTIVVVAYFESGVWIKCLLVNEQLSFCEDASQPYTAGFAHLLTGEPLPDDCQGCLPRVSAEWTDWLAAQGAHFTDELLMTRQAAEGSYILMRAESGDGRYALECWFNGISPTYLESCEEVD